MLVAPSLKGRSGPHGSGTLCNACGSKWKAGRIVANPDGTLRLVDPPNHGGRGRTDGAGPPKKKKKSLAVAYTITYEQKRELSMAIERLGMEDPNRLAMAVEIIKRGMPQIGDTDEIELDMDVVDEKTLVDLWRFVKGGDPWAANGNGHAR